MDRAGARARSATTSVNEFNTGSCLTIRASAASTAASADVLRRAPARAIPDAGSQSPPACTAMSGCKDTGRLGFIGQREFVDQPRQSQRDLKVGAHRRLPGVLNRKRQRLSDGVDVVIKRIS